MYTAKIKFQFEITFGNADKFDYLAGLIKDLEAQSIGGEHLVSGGIYNYQIEHNGKVSLSSCFPGSTSIIDKFIKLKRKEGLVK